MTDIISAIDNATGCYQCGNPLGGSPSSDFCSEYCQRVWQANRVGAPLGRVGLDYSMFTNSAAALPEVGAPLSHLRMQQDGTVEVLILPDTRALTEAFRRMGDSLAGFMRGMSISATRAAQAVDSLMKSCEPYAARQSAMDKALEARRTRNTGPSVASRAPRSINPKRNR